MNEKLNTTKRDLIGKIEAYAPNFPSGRRDVAYNKTAMARAAGIALTQLVRILAGTATIETMLTVLDRLEKYSGGEG